MEKLGFEVRLQELVDRLTTIRRSLVVGDIQIEQARELALTEISRAHEQLLMDRAGTRHG